jgi:hypothetical protein
MEKNNIILEYSERLNCRIKDLIKDLVKLHEETLKAGGFERLDDDTKRQFAEMEANLVRFNQQTELVKIALEKFKE